MERIFASASKALSAADIQKATKPMQKEYKWVQVLNRFIAIGHRPGKRSVAAMKRSGTDAILTLLKETEGARETGDAVARHDIEWIWLPFIAKSNFHNCVYIFK